jgi:plastocyanin
MKKILLVALSLLVACATIRPTPGGFSIEPATARASPGSTLLLLATGAPPVTWTATGGTITPAGALTVPGCSAALPLTITVTATSGTSTATSSITVEDAVTGITVSPSTVKVAPGGTVNFTATVKTVCFPAGSAQAVKVQRSAVAAK